MAAVSCMSLASKTAAIDPLHEQYNPGFWNNDCSSEDKVWARKSGLYTIHRLSFAKNLF